VLQCESWLGLQAGNGNALALPMRLARKFMLCRIVAAQEGFVEILM
jgi:hypothetical protein